MSGKDIMTVRQSLDDSVECVFYAEGKKHTQLYDNDEFLNSMENLNQAYPKQIKLIYKMKGFTMASEIWQKGVELAGLDLKQRGEAVRNNHLIF